MKELLTLRYSHSSGYRGSSRSFFRDFLPYKITHFRSLLRGRDPHERER